MELKAVNLTPEELMVVLCCRQTVKQNAAKKIDSLLVQNLNWATIEYMIELHGIIGSARAALSKYAHTVHVPNALIERLKQKSIKIAFKNQLYINEFHALVKACNREQIPLMPLKGIAFLMSLYAHNTTLRSLSDIDILFKKKDLQRVNEILTALGYQRKHMRASEESRSFHSIYRRRVSGFTILIEAHWDFDHPESRYAIDINECWQRARETKKDTGGYYELSPEDNLMLNCFHILRNTRKGPDNLLRLKHFCDIGLIISFNNGTIDWKCFVQRARHYKVIRPVGMVLLLVLDLLGVEEIPFETFNVLQAEGFQDDFAACVAREYIFDPFKREKKALPFLMVDMATASGLSEKIKIVMGAPKIFLTLYRAKYYERYGRSTPRALAHITWYYARKVAAAFSLWIRAPRKTARLQKEQVLVNRKTQKVINWLRG